MVEPGAWWADLDFLMLAQMGFLPSRAGNAFGLFAAKADEFKGQGNAYFKLDGYIRLPGEVVYWPGTGKKKLRTKSFEQELVRAKKKRPPKS